MHVIWVEHVRLCTYNQAMRYKTSNYTVICIRLNICTFCVATFGSFIFYNMRIEQDLHTCTR